VSEPPLRPRGRLQGPARAQVLGRINRRFLADTNGATAIEFAFIAMPFFALLFAIIQTALVLFISEALQTALNNASRQIMTGEAKAAGLTLSTFKAKVCDGVPILACGKIRLQVQAFTTISTIRPNTPDTKCFDPEQTPPASCYNPGKANDFVILRAGYSWPIGIGLANMNGTTMLINTAATRNENYP
jgi:Flp pilus assembly pilin Flp